MGGPGVAIALAWRAGLGMVPGMENVARFLPEAAARVPEHCAVRAPVGRRRGRIRYEELTFAELERDSNACARLLQERGVRRGMRVLLMVKPGLDLILVVFALYKLGAPPVVIDPGMGLKSFLRCVQRSEPEALVGIPLAHGVAKVCRRAFARANIRVAAGTRGFRRAVAAHGSEEAFPIAATEAEELAAILFTSGSTGPPKGVRYEHGMFAAQVRLIREQYGIEPTEVDLPMLPVFSLFNPAFGMTTVVPEMNPSRPGAADPRKLVQAIRQNAVTNSFGSPVLWAKVCAYCEQKGVELPTLQRVLMAGAPVPTGLIERFRKVIPNGEVHTPYGATEALPVSSIRGAEIEGETAAHARAGKGTCVGKPLPEMEVKAMRITEGPVERLEPSLVLPAGEVGELIVRGPVVTKAYDQLPEATAEAKLQDAEGRLWHRMGDAGYLDTGGRVWFCGRVAERLVIGEEVWLTECIEPLFNAHPRVFRTALIGVRASGRLEPGLVVEPERGQFPEDRAALARELRQWVKDHPQAGRIALFWFVKKMPTDVRHNAKIHRLRLGRDFSRKPKNGVVVEA